jgi:hypothetical protein
MPRLHRALAWALASVCAACQVASAPSIGSKGPATAPAPFEVGIDGVYLTQSVQDYAGTVPLVQGRAGLLRIFLRSRQPNVSAPVVRIHIVDTATGDPVQSYTAQSHLQQVPTFIVEGASGGSWNVSIPGEDVKPGRHIVAEMDPVQGVPLDQLRQSFRYPAEGSLDVRPARQLLVTLVPIVQSGLEPEVVTSTRTADGWIDRARWIHPLGGVDVALGSTYTTSTALGADGSGWADILAELDRKRVAEGSARTYLGVVKVSYQSGTVGHNFGLKHAPCGVDPSSADPAWPKTPAYADAHIGTFGWDPVTGALKDPAANWDHMSYCGTADTTWTSDYSYRASMAFLSGQTTAQPAAIAARSFVAAPDTAPVRQPCLLVSGLVRDGRVELEPAYVVDTLPTRPPSGEYTLDLLDRDGVRLASLPFAPTSAAAEEEGHPEEAHFAMAVPLSSAASAPIEGLAVRRGGVELVRRVAAGAPSVDGAANGVEVSGTARRTNVRWDHRRHPEVMVRDPRTGEILGFARGGTAMFHTEAPELELVLSDGVRSERPVRARAR